MLGEELRPGLRAWSAYHAEWRREVRGFAVVEPERLTLIDPLLVGEQWEQLAALRGERALAVLVTIHWHVRAAAEIRERHPDTTVWAYSRDRAAVARRAPVGRTFGLGEGLPGGLVALAARPRTEVVFWDAAHAALIAGDALLGDGEKGEGLHLCPESWLPGSTNRDELRDSLRPTLDLPVELVLPAHGELVLTGAHAALARALA